MTAPPTVGASRADRTPGWLRDELPALLEVATALTGSAPVAADLVAETIVRAGGRLRRLEDTGFADDELRTLVVRQFLAGHRRRPRTDLPTAGLDALAPRTRAVVVLRDGVGMTALTIGSVLDRTPAQISTDLTAPSYASEIASLGAAAPHPDQVINRLTAAGRRVRARRRRLSAVGTVVAVIVAAAVSVPTLLVPRLPADSRPAGVWRFSHDVRLSPGWSVAARMLTATSEVTQLQRPPGGETGGCAVTVHTAGSYDPAEATRISLARVHGRDGFIGQDDGNNYVFAWEYAHDAWASVSCYRLALDESELTSIAGQVRFRPMPLKIPYRLADLPSGYRVLGLTEYPLTQSTELQLTKDDIEPGEVNLVIAAPLDEVRPTPSRGEILRVDGWEGIMTGGSHPRMCVNVGGDALCLLTYWPGGNWPEPAPYPARAEPALRSLSGNLRLASDLRDQESWFEAEVALPR